METKKVRPVLCESKRRTKLLIENEILTTIVSSKRIQLGDTFQQLILISLDPDEKIEVGDVFYSSKYNTIDTLASNGVIDKLTSYKVIATQSQLWPEHTQDECAGFIDGYEARKSEEQTNYTNNEVNLLFHKYLDDHSILNTDRNHAIMDVWFNENKKQ